jgi:hypothetical protein
VKGASEVEWSDVEFAERERGQNGKLCRADFGFGARLKHAQTIGPAFDGAETRAGASDETNIYADL